MTDAIQDHGLKRRLSAQIRSLLLVGALAALSATVTFGMTNVVAWGDDVTVPTVSNAVAISGGWAHSLALCPDGSVEGVGFFYSGATYTLQYVPDGLTNVVALSAGMGHDLAVRIDGSVVAWGDREAGGRTNVPSGLGSVVAVAASSYHSLALCADSSVVAWGANMDGRASVPAGLTNVVAVAVGESHSLAVRADGSVVAWGKNSYGCASVPMELSNVVAVAGGSLHSVALRADGTVTAWGDNLSGQTNVPPGLSNVVAVAAGRYHSVALRADGSVVAWGFNGLGRTNVPAALTNAVAVGAGAYHSLAVVGVGKPCLTPMVKRIQAPLGLPVFLQARPAGVLPMNCLWKKDGSPLAGATNILLTLTATNANQAGDYHCVVSNAQGVTTGSVTHINVLPLVINVPPLGGVVFIGQKWTFSVELAGATPLGYQWQKDGLPIGSGTSRTFVVSSAQLCDDGLYDVVISNQYGCVTSATTRLSVGNVVAWGRNDYGQTDVPSGLSNAVAVAAGGEHSLVLGADGSIDLWGANYHAQTNLPSGLSNMVAVAAGGDHNLALGQDGSVTGSGMYYNGSGWVPMYVPPGLSNTVAVTAGWDHNLVLGANGSVDAWGAFYNGAAYVLISVPQGISNIVAATAGGSHCLAVNVNGLVTAWGRNDYGQTDVPSGLSNVVAVAAGGYHSLALRANGTIAAWGRNNNGQTDVPSGLSNMVAVAAGNYHSLALCENGSVVAWGYNGNGQTNVPSGLTNVVMVTAGGSHSMAVVGVGKPFLPPMVNRIVAQKPPVFLNACPAGVRPLNCQWQKNGMSLAGGGNPLLVISATNADQSGDYLLIVSNTLGVTTGNVVHVTVLDNNGNDIPDAWEIQYFGGMTNLNSHSDSDGDGSPDLNEFIAGTDPTNKFSLFALAGVNASSTNGFIVQWNSVSNKYYTVGRATNGLVVGFVPVATNIPATFPVNTYTDSVDGAGSAFYRITVWK